MSTELHNEDHERLAAAVESLEDLGGYVEQLTELREADKAELEDDEHFEGTTDQARMEGQINYLMDAAQYLYYAARAITDALEA